MHSQRRAFYRRTAHNTRMNTLSLELIKHYTDADYLLELDSRRYVLKIGERPAAEFEDFLQSTAANCWAVITAWNPCSRVLSAHQNQQKQAQLEDTLHARGQLFYPAVGQSADGQWQETSVWVPGLSRQQAKELGQLYQQNAVVYGKSGRAAELLVPGTVYLIPCSAS